MKYIGKTLKLVLLTFLYVITTSTSVFKSKQNIFVDTLIHLIFFKRMKINNVRGGLTDTLAKKESLVTTPEHLMLELRRDFEYNDLSESSSQ